MTLSKYRIIPEDTIALLRIVKDEKIEGYLHPWKHGDVEWFDLWLTEEDLVALKLRIRINYCSWLQDQI